jgi:hypothetical protein
MTTTEREWKPETDLEKMAVTIGHYFWKCESDGNAYAVGYDCAKEVEKALNQ